VHPGPARAAFDAHRLVEVTGAGRVDPDQLDAGGVEPRGSKATGRANSVRIALKSGWAAGDVLDGSDTRPP
jgi:hypothetical protein